MTHWVWLLPALPAIAAVLGPATARIMPGGPAGPAIAGTGGALGVAIAALVAVESAPARVHEAAVDWSPIGGVTLHVGTRLDGLDAVVAVMVSVVALLVQIYSIAYRAGAPPSSIYAAEVSLFTAAMLLSSCR